MSSHQKISQVLSPGVTVNRGSNKRIAENTALDRAGVPDDLGPVVASLLSEENRWVNPQRIEVAGGVAIWKSDGSL
jgi:NAD(P)-dependent dehydrogenase (short-subunit alcohol dehydrogenase family)